MNRRALIHRRLCIEGWLLHVAGLVATLGCAVLAVVAIIRPAQAKTIEVSAECARLDEFLKSASDIRAQARDIRRQIDEARARSARLAARIPNAPHEAEFLGQVTALAREVELEIQDYRPGLVRLMEKHGEMEVQLSAQGTYSAICRLLRRTEELPRLCQVNRLEIKAPQTGNLCQIDLTLVIYFAPDQPASVPPGGNPRGR